MKTEGENGIFTPQQVICYRLPSLDLLHSLYGSISAGCQLRPGLLFQWSCWCSSEVLGGLSSSWALPASYSWHFLFWHRQTYPEIPEMAPIFLDFLLAPVVGVLWWCQDSPFLGKSIPGLPCGGKKLENIKKKKWTENKKVKRSKRSKRTERISVQEITQINLFSLPLLF